MAKRSFHTLIAAFANIPVQLRTSITWDQGWEMSLHEQITAATGARIYFCDPHSPWQRGTNENTNRLLEWSPKVGLLMEPYAMAGVWVRYSSGLR